MRFRLRKEKKHAVVLFVYRIGDGRYDSRPRGGYRPKTKPTRLVNSSPPLQPPPHHHPHFVDKKERERQNQKKKRSKNKTNCSRKFSPEPDFFIISPPPDILIRPPPPPPPPRRRRSPASKRRSHPALVGGTGVCVCDGDGLLPARARRREGLVGRRARPPCLSAWIGIELKVF